MIEIRPMTLDDLHDVRAIERLSFATPWSYQAFYNELTTNDNAYYLAAHSGGTLVGYVGLWLILDEGHITNIAVRPEYRSQGIGKQLLHAITAWAQSKGVLRMTLEVRVSNTRAQALYEGLGYRPAGIRKKYYIHNNEDAIIMWKDLTKDEQGAEDRPSSGN